MRRIKGEYYTQADQYTSHDGQIPNVRVCRIYIRIYIHKDACGLFQLDFFLF